MYEYRVTQLLAGGNIQHLNDRIAHMVSEGWEPFLLTGDTIVSVMLRRPVQAGAAGQVGNAAQARHPSLMPDQPAPVQQAAPAAPVPMRQAPPAPPSPLQS
jgi:hypothetical protein